MATDAGAGARRFAGQSVLVTGASRGLGRAVAAAFAAEGAHVHVGYRAREDEARATLDAVRACGGEGVLWPLDVRDAESVKRAVEGALAARGAIDVLVNSAAVAHDAAAAMMTDEQFAAIVDTNLNGTFRCCRAVLREMMAARRGAIVNMGSVASARATPGQANYAASKGGVVALTQTLASEAAAFGVRVNAVLPGMTTTGMAARMDRAASARLSAHIPLRRAGEPGEIAAAVLFLASAAASYVVGQALVVDGGLTL